VERLEREWRTRHIMHAQGKAPQLFFCLREEGKLRTRLLRRITFKSLSETAYMRSVRTRVPEVTAHQIHNDSSVGINGPTHGANAMAYAAMSSGVTPITRGP
jgi:hypothetical protein